MCSRTMIINMRERATEQEVQHASDPELSVQGQLLGAGSPANRDRIQLICSLTEAPITAARTSWRPPTGPLPIGSSGLAGRFSSACAETRGPRFQQKSGTSGYRPISQTPLGIQPEFLVEPSEFHRARLNIASLYSIPKLPA